MEIFAILIIGAAAGWLGSVIFKGSGLGLLGNIVVGIIGAILTGAFGALIVLFAINFLFRRLR